MRHVSTTGSAASWWITPALDWERVCVQQAGLQPPSVRGSVWSIGMVHGGEIRGRLTTGGSPSLHNNGQLLPIGKRLQSHCVGTPRRALLSLRVSQSPGSPGRMAAPESAASPGHPWEAGAMHCTFPPSSGLPCAFQIWPMLANPALSHAESLP